MAAKKQTRPPRAPMSEEAKARAVKTRRMAQALNNATSAATYLRAAHRLADADAWTANWTGFANQGMRYGRILSFQVPKIKADAAAGCAVSAAWLLEHADKIADALEQFRRGYPTPFQLRTAEERGAAQQRTAARQSELADAVS